MPDWTREVRARLAPLDLAPAREADIVAIQDHLGHASIGNTMKYVAIASKRRDEFAARLDGWK